MEDKIDPRIRQELRCIAIHEPIWQQAKELAALDGRSVSSFLREVIKKEYRNSKKQRKVLVG